MVVSSGLPIMLSSQPLPLNRCCELAGAPVALRMDEDQHAELLGLGPERMELRIGELLAVDAAADGRRRAARASSRRPRAARRRDPDTAAPPRRRPRSDRVARRTTPRASRSGCWMSCLARSRSALYQKGLMLSASTSMPCSSIACRRSDTCVAMSRSRPERRAAELQVHSASASGTAQCACTSTVFTRWPFTTTSRRRAWARAGAAAIRSQPTKTRPRERAGRGLEKFPRCGHGLPPSIMLTWRHYRRLRSRAQ